MVARWAHDPEVVGSNPAPANSCQFLVISRLERSSMETQTKVSRGKSRDYRKATRADVPQLLVLPALFTHDNRHLTSLQLNGRVEGFLLRDGKYCLEWSPHPNMLSRGYEACSFVGTQFVPTVDGLFQKRNHQVNSVTQIESEASYASAVEL